MARGIGHPDREVLMGPSFLSMCCVPGSGLNTAHRRPHAILTYYGNFKLKRGEHRPRDTRCPQPSTCTGEWLHCWPSSRTPAARQYGALLSDSRGQSLVTPQMGQRTLETCLSSLRLCFLAYRWGTSLTSWGCCQDQRQRERVDSEGSFFFPAASSSWVCWSPQEIRRKRRVLATGLKGPDSEAREGLSHGLAAR